MLSVDRNWDFSLEDRILLVGEGDFSFACWLCEYLTDGSNITATAFDSLETAEIKFPNLQEKLEILQDYEAKVYFNIDATNLKNKKIKVYDKIIFNFPHAGKGIKDQDRNILCNQELLLGFLSQAESYLAEFGRIYVTLKLGIPYDLWDLKKISVKCGYATLKSFVFNPKDYPGYAHRRTIGYKEGVSKDDSQECKNCRTWCFIKKS